MRSCSIHISAIVVDSSFPSSFTSTAVSGIYVRELALASASHKYYAVAHNIDTIPYLG